MRALGGVVAAIAITGCCLGPSIDAPASGAAAGPTPPIAAPPIAAAPPIVAPGPAIAPAVPAAAGTVPAAAGATLGRDPVIPVAGLAPPATEGAAWEELAIDWSVLRDLLAATTPVSRGTRHGYRALDREHNDVGGWLEEPGLELRDRAAWWRPTSGVVLLAVPYFLPGRNGGTTVAIFEPAPGGARYAAHVTEPGWEECWDSSMPTQLVGTLRGGRAIRVSSTCGDLADRWIVTVDEGAIRVAEDDVPLQGSDE